MFGYDTTVTEKVIKQKILSDNHLDKYHQWLAALQIFGKPKSTPFTILSVMEWEQPQTKENFTKVFKIYYPDNNVATVMGKVEKWVTR